MSALEDLIQPNFAPIVGAAISGAVAIQTIFVRWLINNFKELRTDMKEINERMLRWLDAHESSDQMRHEDNLYRFEKISVALARLGSENGTHDHKHN